MTARASRPTTDDMSIDHIVAIQDCQALLEDRERLLRNVMAGIREAGREDE